MSEEFKLEEKNLEYVKLEVKKLLAAEEIKFNGLPKEYAADVFLLQQMMILSYNKIRGLKNMDSKPYFSRIDFVYDETGHKEICYIGKIGSSDTEGKVMVTDWRTPIASIYYEGNIGNVSYQSPGGLYTGVLKLKRQIVIEDGELKNVFDVDSVSDDELLKPYLGVNADDRLKNIIATIQSEQNAIIRLPIDMNVIVQGVAGSGKTTVALHRVAYLVYNYQKNYKSDQFMVIGPNKFFVNYISAVLPDLDVNNVNQLTFEELALDYVGEKFEVKNSSAKLVEIINSNENESRVSMLKSSMEYKSMIERFMDVFRANIILNENIVFNGVTILTSDEIKADYEARWAITSIKVRLETTTKSLISKIKNNAAKLEGKYVNLFKLIPDKEKTMDIWDFKTALKKELSKGFEGHIKKRLGGSKLTVLGIYKDFIQNIENYCLEQNLDLMPELKKDTLKDLMKKKIDFEDIAAILYITSFFKENKDYKKYVHTVLDESQDYGEFHFHAIKQILSSSKFSIFGDLSQGIYSYRGTTDWNIIIKSVFNGSCELINLEKSYRTTVEIMTEANKIIRKLKYTEATPVIRHGEKVNYLEVNPTKQEIDILNVVTELKKKSHKSIAVICKTSIECEKLFKLISKKVLDLKLITSEDTIYEGGLCIIPAHLSKGLEYDAVILVNVSSKTYHINNPLDLKLLYVAMTRALHELIVFCDPKEKILKVLA